MKFYTIYKITHIETGKFYIGRHVTSNLDDGYMGSGKYIRHAIRKYGVDSFSKEYLFIFDNEDDMYAKEAELVTEEFCLREDTYNIAPGGFAGGWDYINSNGLRDIGHTQEMYARVSKALVGRENPNASVRMKSHHENSKIRYDTCGMLGKNHSKLSRSKMSNSQKGSRNSQYGLQWITNGVESKKIKKEDLIPEGWKKGRYMKLTLSHRG